MGLGHGGGHHEADDGFEEHRRDGQNRLKVETKRRQKIFLSSPQVEPLGRTKRRTGLSLNRRGGERQRGKNRGPVKKMPKGLARAAYGRKVEKRANVEFISIASVFKILNI